MYATPVVIPDPENSQRCKQPCAEIVANLQEYKRDKITGSLGAAGTSHEWNKD